MVYKSILLSILLLPVASYAKSNETRIKELEEAQFQKELEFSNLVELLNKRHKTLDYYKSNTSNLLKLLRKSNEQLKIEVPLDQLIKNFKTEFDNAIDFKQLFEKSFIENDDEISYESFRAWMLIVVTEKQVIDKLTVKCEICVKELIKINTELKELKKTEFATAMNQAGVANIDNIQKL
ncbi:MAG: hypothetical protein P4L31_00105 [Candidatus Babeliales bacterium]|nr:hypothetical protein [Candidatus Babeliales bacterium]